MNASERRLLGAWLRWQRIDRGLSAHEVARALKCDVSAVYHVERGSHLPGLTVLARWLAFLGVDLLTQLGARHLARPRVRP